MIKVIVHHWIKSLDEVWSLLRELRSAAIQHPGYIKGETLLEKDNQYHVITISTWADIDSWNSWQKSAKRAEIFSRIKPLQIKDPVVEIYEIIGTGK